MTNYICINGNKTELTEEQLKQLGIEIPKANPFTRAKKGVKYFTIMQDGTVDWHYENMDAFDRKYFNIANYCADESLMEQRALHEILNRLLWRYSMEHGGDKIERRDGVYAIKYIEDDILVVYGNFCTIGVVTFNTKEVTENAIEEIIKPFMKAHPEFKF